MKTYSIKGLDVDYEEGKIKPRISKFVFLFGVSRDLYGRLMSYYGTVNQILVISIFYSTCIATHSPIVEWMSLPFFLLCLIIGATVGSLFIWFVDIPFLNYYGSWIGLRTVPIGTKIVLQRFDEIEKKLEEIERKLDGSN